MFRWPSQERVNFGSRTRQALHFTYTTLNWSTTESELSAPSYTLTVLVMFCGCVGPHITVNPKFTTYAIWRPMKMNVSIWYLTISSLLGFYVLPLNFSRGLSCLFIFFPFPSSLRLSMMLPFHSLVSL